MKPKSSIWKSIVFCKLSTVFMWYLPALEFTTPLDFTRIAIENCQFNPPLNFTRILEFNPHYKWFLIGRHFLPSKKLSFDPALVVNKYLSTYLTCLYFIRNDSRGYTFPNIYFLKYFCRNQNTLKKFNPHWTITRPWIYP